ncbi:MAG: hypothetical protein IJL94_04250, partial [Erysipelotrichaceae bacterium]|nr:hypothetical protein [Erysipelotrichaceae bacterium]
MLRKITIVLMSLLITLSNFSFGFIKADDTGTEEKQPVAYKCGKEEHTHEESCYRTITVRVCKEEHEHSAECLQKVRLLTCDKEEHVHDDSCLTKPVQPEFYCGQKEHVHGVDCYVLAGERILDCDKEHEHDDTCYEEVYVFDCKEKEHVHDASCQVAPPVRKAPDKPIVNSLEIRDFSVQLFYGASKQDDKYVWNANSSAKGHAFSFRINYALGGTFSVAPEGIRIELPLHILKDRYGNDADTLEMSIPTRQDVENGEPIDSGINYAYYIEGDKIIIYNFKEVFTGENGYIELSYYTSQSTYEYTDMSEHGPFYADITIKKEDEEVK